MTVNSRVVKTFLQWSNDSFDVPLPNGLRIQIIPTMADLARARKHQFAAFIADAQLLVVWDDDPLNLITRASQIESSLMALVWKIGADAEEEVKDEKMIGLSIEEVVDIETGETSYRERRPTNLLNTILVGCTLILVFCMLAAGYREIAIETAVDRNYLRLLFVLLTPVQIFFTLVSRGFWIRLICVLLTCTSSLPKLSSDVWRNVSDPPRK